MTIVGAQSIRDGATLTAMEESSDRLTATAHWDAVHRTSASSGRLRAVARTVLGEEAFDFFVQGGYVGYTFRELLRPLVRPGQRILGTRAPHAGRHRQGARPAFARERQRAAVAGR